MLGVVLLFTAPALAVRLFYLPITFSECVI